MLRSRRLTPLSPAGEPKLIATLVRGAFPRAAVFWPRRQVHGLRTGHTSPTGGGRA